MSAKVLRHTLRPISFHSLKHHPRREFLTLPGTEIQSLTATRILPYNSTSLYTIIADVDSYSSFVPYCTDSAVTSWSSPDTYGKKWPSQADLKVGWGSLEETFTSRLFCVPGSVVEALSGDAITELPKSDISHHSATFDSLTPSSSMFKSLRTKWVVKPLPDKPSTGLLQKDITKPSQDQTEVHLSIDFQFANPIYAALSSAVAPKIAGMMIEAFEDRARSLLESSNHKNR